MTRVAFAALLLLGGCTDTDPYIRPGMWQPTGANKLNLAAMLVQPNDMIRGRGTTGTPGVEAAGPVTRYWAGRPVALPTSTSQQTSVGQARPEASGPAATGAGAN